MKDSNLFENYFQENFEIIEKILIQDKIAFKNKEVLNLAYQVKAIDSSLNSMIEKFQNIRQYSFDNFGIVEKDIIWQGSVWKVKILINEFKEFNKNINSLQFFDLVQVPLSKSISIIFRTENRRDIKEDYFKKAQASLEIFCSCIDNFYKNKNKYLKRTIQGELKSSRDAIFIRDKENILVITETNNRFKVQTCHFDKDYGTSEWCIRSSTETYDTEELNKEDTKIVDLVKVQVRKFFPEYFL